MAKHKETMNVAEFFYHLRISREWTQQDMAYAFDVTQSYVAQLETGKYKKLPMLFIRKIYQSPVLTKEEKEDLLRALHSEITLFVSE